MGEIGKHLPKVMWPVFHKSLLEVQVLFARSLGYEKIYINIHHQADIILGMTKDNHNFKNVVWLKEDPDILDIGGGIHNLAQQSEINYQGRLLVLNADQLLWFTRSDLQPWLSALENHDAILLSLMVNSSQGYNQLVLEKSILKEIKPNKEIHPPQDILTYTGNALINLNTLKRASGVSKFFESVCSFDRKNLCVNVSRHPYWDFGTKERYFESLKRIVREIKVAELEEFYHFLESSEIFRSDLADPELVSYNSRQPESFNLTLDGVIENGTKGVLIAGHKLGSNGRVAFGYKEITDYLK